MTTTEQVEEVTSRGTEAKTIKESDLFIVLRDGRADYTGKGQAETRS
ncbi:MAG: hypothetical protein JW874_00320 [Spirochaetales bacterium]|nr:hypothetical protein [Spirochaetales bacterium]